MIKVDSLLFSTSELRGKMEIIHRQISADIEKIKKNQLLNTNVDDWCDYFAQTYQIVPLALKEEQIIISDREAKVDVSHDFRYNFSTIHIPGSIVSYYIPFDGDGDLFIRKATTYTLHLLMPEFKAMSFFYPMRQLITILNRLKDSSTATLRI